MLQGDRQNPSTALVAAITAGMAIMPDGRKAFVTEFSCHKISIVNTATGKVSTLAGTGTAGFEDHVLGTIAKFFNPTDVKLTPDGGKVFITDLYNNKIRSINLETR